MAYHTWMYRRLPIICLEDVLLHPGLPLLTWLMAAQAKGYELGEAAASEVLRITYQIAAVRGGQHLAALMTLLT